MRSFALGIMALAGLALGGASCSSSEGTSSSSGGSGGGGPVASAGSGTGGSGGGATAPAPVACGSQMCLAIAVGAGFAAPCCVDPMEGTCGADVSALMPSMGCQPLHQPGVLDPACPPSTLGMLPGCCREATGQCGFMLSDLGGLLPFAPGCIDATTVDAASVPQACGGEGGASGQPTGAGGEGGDTGTEPAAGGAAMGGDSSGGASSAP